MSDEAYFFLCIVIASGIISWAILRYWMPRQEPTQEEEQEDEHLHI